MDKQKLKQYRALQKEVPDLRQKLERLYTKRANIPVVLGKVTGTSEGWPYIQKRITVPMDDPKAADALERQIRAAEKRLTRAERDRAEIEEFIATLTDSEIRQIFELAYIDGLSQEKIAEKLGYTKGRISQKIAEFLKD